MSRNPDAFHDDQCDSLYGRAIGLSGPCTCPHQSGNYCEEDDPSDTTSCTCWKGEQMMAARR